MEEWHQKLHNNSSPDDVIICEVSNSWIHLPVLRGERYINIRPVVFSFVTGTLKLCEIWFQNRCLLANAKCKWSHKRHTSKLWPPNCIRASFQDWCQRGTSPWSYLILEDIEGMKLQIISWNFWYVSLWIIMPNRSTGLCPANCMTFFFNCMTFFLDAGCSFWCWPRICYWNMFGFLPQGNWFKYYWMNLPLFWPPFACAPSAFIKSEYLRLILCWFCQIHEFVDVVEDNSVCSLSLKLWAIICFLPCIRIKISQPPRVVAKLARVRGQTPSLSQRPWVQTHLQ